MRIGRSDRLVPLALAAGSFLIALLQRPGLATSDTKIDLHVDPSGFLGRVADVWSPTAGLGHVQGGQYGGYLWPMGPFFAALHGLGLSPWLVQRLWLGTLLALAAWGTVRLLDALFDRRRGVAHVVAGTLVVLNPYVVVFTSRTTFTLIGYAALPWLLLVVHRGLRDPRRWWWPAAFALIVTSVGGGVNAAVLAWLLVGPLLLVLYEPVLAGVPWRAAGALAWRTALATAAASVWWVVPVLVQSSYGLNFLTFTEQVGSIWGTTSLSETLRLMGYWPSYLGVGYGEVLKPYFGDSGTLLFSLPEVVATLVVPGLALAGFVWTRRWRYGPFFLTMALLGVLIMSVGFPEGTPLRKGATFAYNHVQALQFLRTTYKAGPLVALALACLAGVAAAELWRRLADRRPQLAVVVAFGALLVALASWPFFQGRAVELTWKRIPAPWTSAGHDLDHSLPRNTRAVVLPGQPFAFYRWGGTVDPILPSLTSRPVAVRNVPPYDDIHAVDALWTVDNLVQQQRLLPGELRPLLELMSTGAVVTGSDDDTGRSGAMPPAAAARELAPQLGAPSRAYGPVSRFRPPPDTIDPPAALPEVRSYAIAGSRGIVRVEPAVRIQIVDGSAGGVGDLASLGDLAPAAPLRYAGDASPSAIRSAAVTGSPVTITDSNRRRAFVASRPRQSAGWTLAADEAFSADAAVLDPFPGRGAGGQTVAVYQGVRYVRAPYSPQIAQFPEHRPYAAFDGDPNTSWLADPTLEQARHYIEVGFLHPLAVPYVDILPDDSNPRVAVTQVTIAGRAFAIHPGWNRVPVELARAGSLRVAITGQRTSGNNAGSAGGFREIRVPGVHVRELLRPPVLAERALAGADLSHTPLAYVFERTTADEPFRRGPLAPEGAVQGNRAEAEAALVRTAQDPETGLDRTFSPPAARSWSAGGWATVSPGAPDPAIDALAGTRTSGATFTSSGRFEGRPAFRASAAFDGTRARAWVARWQAGRPAWIAVRSPRPLTLRRLTLARAPLAARAPTHVVVSWAGGQASLPVGPYGAVTLPRRVRTRTLRVDVTATTSGPPAVAIGEIAAPGLPRAAQPAPSAAVLGRCGMLSGTAGGTTLALRPSGTAASLDAGTPLRVAACGGPLALPRGAVDLHVPGRGLLRPYVLELRSPAPAPLVRAAQAGGGSVLDPGHMGHGSYSGVKVGVRGPSWLVLGESFNSGWQASCNGHDLGRPQVVDGFANGWRVGPGCHDVSMSFAPQKAVDIGYAIGALAVALLLLVMALRRPPSSTLRPPPSALPTDDARAPWPPGPAASAGLAAGVVLGFVFAIRAGVVIAPAVALILWRGFGPRTLILAAGALLAVVVPLLYVLFPGDNRGGYDTQYAVEHLGAHWVTVAALVLLLLALWRTFSTATGRPLGGRARGRQARDERRAPA